MDYLHFSYFYHIFTNHKFRKLFYIVLGLLTLFYIFLYCYRISNNHISFQSRSTITKVKILRNVTFSSTCSANYPCIAIATAYFFKWEPWEQMINNTCEFYCDYVHDIQQAHAVVFNARDINSGTYKILPRRSDQYWIYLNTENPLATIQYGYDVSKHLEYRFFFNWTATYARKSDIYTPYGEYVSKEKALSSMHPELFYNKTAKTTMAYIVVSNCEPYNSRLNDILLLQKLIQVDTFGKCFNNTLSGNWNIFQEMSKKYWFYISYENAFCTDYITEKLFNNGLVTESVPVVYGGLSKEEYTAVAPPNSFIYAGDFKSTLDLVNYLKRLILNQAEYAKFFEWKKYYKFVSTVREDRMLCNICKKLSVTNLANITNSRADLKTYYNVNNCKRV